MTRRYFLTVMTVRTPPDFHFNTIEDNYWGVGQNAVHLVDIPKASTNIFKRLQWDGNHAQKGTIFRSVWLFWRSTSRKHLKAFRFPKRKRLFRSYRRRRWESVSTLQSWSRMVRLCSHRVCRETGKDRCPVKWGSEPIFFLEILMITGVAIYVPGPRSRSPPL